MGWACHWKCQLSIQQNFLFKKSLPPFWTTVSLLPRSFRNRCRVVLSACRARSPSDSPQSLPAAVSRKTPSWPAQMSRVRSSRGFFGVLAGSFSGLPPQWISNRPSTWMRTGHGHSSHPVSASGGSRLHRLISSSTESSSIPVSRALAEMTARLLRLRPNGIHTPARRGQR